MRVKFVSRDYKNLKTYSGLRIWEKPKEMHKYAIGVDVSEGVGQDASCCQVVDCSTGTLVANYWSDSVDVDNYSTVIYKLGLYYNKAHVCIEQNNHGNAVIASLNGAIGGLCYPNLYRRYVFDEYTQKKTKKIGFHTTRETKPRIIENLKSALKDGELTVPDCFTINELNTFVRDELSGKMGARGKDRDDRVMALALAWEQARILKESDKYNDDRVFPQKYDPMTGFPI